MKKVKFISVLSILSCLWAPYYISSCTKEDALNVTGNIEGTVTDYETTQAISGVMVDIVANANTTFAKQSRQTGNDGKFAFKDLEAGNYKLSFSRSGYLENNQDVNILAGQTASSDVRLTPASPFKVQGGVLVSYSGAGGDLVIPDNLGITSIGANVFRENATLVSVVIPSGVTSIGNDAFRNCHKLTSIVLPNTLKTIGKDAFEWSGLTSVSIPNSVTDIGENTFFLCSELSTVSLGSGVTSIGESAFDGCILLKTMTVSRTNPISIQTNVFADVPLYDATLRVPTGARNSYSGSYVWSRFGTIVEY